MCVRHDSAGFTLVETLVAATLVCTAVVGLAHLGLVAMAQSAAVQRESLALWLAQGKLEELRASAWTFDVAGARRSDPALALSPTDALGRDTSGFVESFDRFGERLVADATAVYWRRWSIGLVDPIDPDTLLIQSCVVSLATRRGSAPPDACVSTVRTRH